MKKRILIILFAVMGLLVAACSDSGTDSQPQKDPALAVGQTNINLTGNSRWDVIEVSNSGGGILNWSIAEKPDWIDVSELVGSGVTAKDTIAIELTTRFDKLEYGTFDGVVKINSNGGEVTVAVHIEYKAPKLKIESPIINMDRHYSYSELTLINEGGGELQWQITEAPDWLNFEVVGGSIYSRPELVPFRALLPTLDYGSYEDKVIVQSNGGDYEINVYLLYEREVEVYAGVGAAYIELGDAYNLVQKQWGAPDANWYDRPEKTVFIHHFIYNDLGLHFRVKNNSPILYGSGQVGYIQLIQPYDGMTPELIGLNSTTTELVNAYGQPQRKEGSNWIYDGITYVISGGKVNEMVIKDPNF